MNVNEVKKMLKQKNVIVICIKAGDGSLCLPTCPLLEKCYGLS